MLCHNLDDYSRCIGAVCVYMCEQLMTTVTPTCDVLPHCKCQRCCAWAPAVACQRNASTGVSEPSAQRVVSSESLRTHCQRDNGEVSQRSSPGPVLLRSVSDDDSSVSASLCYKNDDYVQAIHEGPHIPLRDDGAAAAVLPRTKALVDQRFCGSEQQHMLLTPHTDDAIGHCCAMPKVTMNFKGQSRTPAQKSDDPA